MAPKFRHHWYVYFVHEDAGRQNSSNSFLDIKLLLILKQIFEIPNPQSENYIAHYRSILLHAVHINGAEYRLPQIPNFEYRKILTIHSRVGRRRLAKTYRHLNPTKSSKVLRMEVSQLEFLCNEQNNKIDPAEFIDQQPRKAKSVSFLRLLCFLQQPESASTKPSFTKGARYTL